VEKTDLGLRMADILMAVMLRFHVLLLNEAHTLLTAAEYPPVHCCVVRIDGSDSPPLQCVIVMHHRAAGGAGNPSDHEPPPAALAGIFCRLHDERSATMKARVFLTLLVLSVLLVIPGMAQGPEPQMTVGTPFIYQGVLRSHNNPVSGTCDFQFSLWDSASGGSQVGATWSQVGVPVTRGLFTVPLDFGAAPFQGANRYLEVAVRCPAGSGAYTTLSPRQAITPAPYAAAYSA
jgi:hypothetical protein